LVVQEQGRLRIRLAEDERDVDAALRLRFRVFNVELGEGLESSWATGRDEDELDAQFHHLIVEDVASRDVIGTYRIQTREMAEAGRGFYSADEFDLSAIPRDVLGDAVELGRACIAKEHRNRQVLFLLWKGLAAYLAAHDKRYLFGCSSITSQDPAQGLAAYAELRRRGNLHPTIHVNPQPDYVCAAEGGDTAKVKIPILFETYLRFGGTILGPPALDRRFQTIDFLTWLDTGTLDATVRRMFFGL
jgi:putative hemolysin